MIADFRLALRSLTKSPGFAVVAIATLALCIGANSAIFTVVNSVLLRPLPYPDSERLVQVYNSYPKSDLEYAGVSIPDYLDRMDRASSIEDGAIYTWESLNLASEQPPTRVLGLRTSPSLFSTLQTAPVRGRAFTAAEAQPGNEHVVMLSHALWRDNFGSRDDAIGQTLRLDGVPYQIIGVMPESFSFPADEVKLWIPFAFTPEQMSMNERGTEYSEMIARLKPGTTPAMLTAECEAIVQQNLLHAENFRPYVEATGFTGIARSMLDQTVKDVRPMLWLLQAGVIAALLIGCANVANLLLTRALARQRELAIRTALGASRWSIVRQLLIESLVLFAIGGGLGLLVAMWSLTGMQWLGVGDLPRGGNVSLDTTAFAFTFICAGVTGIAFGLIPALQASRTDASEALKSAGSRVTAGRRQRLLRNSLVVTEIALSLMLLATTALLMRSFHHLQQQPAGFNPESVMTARFTLPAEAYTANSARVAFAEDVIARLNAIPGVIEAAVTSNIPFGYNNSQGTYRIEDREVPEDQPPPHGQIRSISPGYFATMGVPLQRGRVFTPADSIEAEKVVIIDRVLADRYWPGVDPVGKRLYRGEGEPENMRTIVGVVAAVKHGGLDDPVRKETIYYPYNQRPVSGLTLVVRTSVPPESITGDMRQAVLAADPDLPIYDIQTLASRVTGSLQTRRTPVLLLGLFSGMALLLAALGVYGVLAFSVGQRTQEIGIRMALGAAAKDVLRLILRQGLKLIGIGVGCGVLGYMAISRFLRSLVFEIAPLDAVALVAATVLLIGIAALACLLPARRAARVDPMVALRDE
ncbi:ABC transporter permease [Synoicihabitans lomoniglobus]|uniref:ABC transporter permease n=1 Tax=Synoicihabitans lomoniglobus TaxID=2909285 RepID=A0AAF0CSJ9_9BACT|nr:ABC transporter permease [Opitutaceae bacterium LMO-M01]WED67265.1 ABC transporter permease [Opitutaceae bacterium LMO-M01]